VEGREVILFGKSMMYGLFWIMSLPAATIIVLFLKIRTNLMGMGNGSRRYEKATFAAGCFWDVETAFRMVEGVLETVAGSTGGSVPEPAYEQVESGTTGHAEAVGMVFDPAIVSYEKLLDLFWQITIPPNTVGRETIPARSIVPSSSAIPKDRRRLRKGPVAGLQHRRRTTTARS
jgi:hypothetical protein